MDDQIDLWVDDEGLLVCQPQLNLAATLLAHGLGAATAIFGIAIVLRVDPATGETLGLADTQLDRTLHTLDRPGLHARSGASRTLNVLLGPPQR